MSNSQHELFAQAVADGYSLSEAARRAGYPEASAHNAGSRLNKLPAIRTRIDQIVSARAAGDHQTAAASRFWIMAQLVEVEKAGRESGDLSAANRALELLARLGGHMVERKETYAKVINLHLMTTAQLNQALRQELSSLPVEERRKLLLDAPDLSGLVELDDDDDDGLLLGAAIN
jgi:hypothetical protein